MEVAMGGCLALACFLLGLVVLVLSLGALFPVTLVLWLFAVVFLLAGGRGLSREERELLAEALRARSAGDASPAPEPEPEPPAARARPAGPSALELLCRKAGQVMNRMARWAWSPAVRPTFVIAAAMLAVAAVLALTLRASGSP